MQDNKTEVNKFLNTEDTIDIMLYGQPDIRSARITNAIKRRSRKQVNKAK